MKFKIINMQKIYGFLLENIVLRLYGLIYSDSIAAQLNELRKIAKLSEFELNKIIKEWHLILDK
jgi:hypothetical protein